MSRGLFYFQTQRSYGVLGADDNSDLVYMLLHLVLKYA